MINGTAAIAISESSLSFNNIGLFIINNGTMLLDLTRDVFFGNSASAIDANGATVGSSLFTHNGQATAGTVISYGNNQVTGPLGSGFSGIGLQ